MQFYVQIIWMQMLFIKNERMEIGEFSYFNEYKKNMKLFAH